MSRKVVLREVVLCEQNAAETGSEDCSVWVRGKVAEVADVLHPSVSADEILAFDYTHSSLGREKVAEVANGSQPVSANEILAFDYDLSSSGSQPFA